MSVFVTVGTTSFDDLTQAITTDPAKQALASHGYQRVTIQFGRGEEVKCAASGDDGLHVEAFRYKDSIADEIRHADLVISHAGAGSCLEVLEAGKPLLVVVNEKLMDNHQLELAQQLFDDGHLLYCTCVNLVETLEKMDLSSLKPLPTPKTDLFAKSVAAHFGVAV